jgi:DNA-binding IscR family transcriptional regulator
VLGRDAGQISAGDVIRAVGETLEPVYCVEDDPQANCPRLDGCPTHWLWAKLGEAINEVLDSITPDELCQHASI